MDWNTITKLADILVWPVVVMIALIAFRKPFGAFLSGISGRVSGLAVLDVISVKLAQLPEPPSPWSDSRFPESSLLTSGDVNSTALMTLFNLVNPQMPSEKGPWDYLIVDIKEGHSWLMSRLFIFTVFLRAMRGLKCVVFVESMSEVRRRLLGITPADTLCAVLSKEYPWFEKALANAQIKRRSLHLGPELGPMVAGDLIRDFIEDPYMRMSTDPELAARAQLESSTTRQTANDQPDSSCKHLDTPSPTDPITPQDWERLGDKDIWEHTHWLSCDMLNNLLRRHFFEWDSSHYQDEPNLAPEVRVKNLLRRRAPYVALVNSKDEFQHLLDRQKLAVLVGEAMVDR